MCPSPLDHIRQLGEEEGQEQAVKYYSMRLRDTPAPMTTREQRAVSTRGRVCNDVQGHTCVIHPMGLGVAGELKAWCLEGGSKRHRQENSGNLGENLPGPPDLHVH